jgi:hypothetical protein
MKNLTIVYPMPLHDIADLRNCVDYPTMQAHYIHRYAQKKSISVGTPYNWLYKSSSNKFKELLDRLTDHGINLNNVENLLITGVNSLKYFNKVELKKIQESIKGNLYQIDDSNFNQNPFSLTFSHYTKTSHSSDRSVEISLAIASDLFCPCQNFNNSEFVVHIDHRWTKTERLECFQEIREKLFLLQRLISQSLRWKKLKIVYHTDEIDDINRIGTYDPKSVPIIDLAKIYGCCHLAFLSHAETLGQYPLEMLSAGATILMRRKMIPKETRGLYPFKIYDKFNYENYLNTVDEKIIDENRRSILKYDYSLWVEKMINSIR